MQKGAGPVRTEAVLLHVRNRYVPGAYGVAPVRCTPHCGRAGARPSQGITAPKEHPPRVRKRPPGCRKVLAPFAPRRCSYTYETATFRVHMAQRGCATPRIADELVLVLPGHHRAVGAPAPGAKTPSRMQKSAGPVRTEAVLLHVRNHYVPGAYGAARVRYTPYCGRAGARPSLGITAP